MNKHQLRKSQQGMTLIELMIALNILVIGMGALMILIATAIASNNGTKQDTSATMIAQLVAEQVASAPANTSPILNILDCSGAIQQINTAGGAPPTGAGATLIAAGQPSAGDINWVAQTFGAVTPRYAMRYVACGTLGRQSTYEVRWNVQTLTPDTKLITVSARRRDREGTSRTAIGFNMPVTIRTISGR